MKSNEKYSQLRELWEAELQKRGVKNRERFCDKQFGRRLNTILNIVNGKTKNVDDDLVAKFAEVLGNSKEQFTALQKDASRNYHGSELEAINVTASDDPQPKESQSNGEPNLNNPQAQKKRHSLIVLLLGVVTILAIGITVLGKSLKISIADKELEKMCTVELMATLSPTILCPKINGRIHVDGPLNLWHTKVSYIFVPPGWVVQAYYETWKPPEYTTEDPDKKGHVLLKIGSNHFNTDRYRVFSDFSLRNFKRDSYPDELNNKIQYLLIVEAGEGQIIVKADDTDQETEVVSFRYVASQM